jgi:hypothetical protein
MVRVLGVLCLLSFCSVVPVLSQSTQPLVAIHDSELTRALESMPATADTPTGTGTTNKQWWPTDWHYFVMPEAVKEALRSDGTAFTVVGDSNITVGVLLTNGAPKYPIVISLASEAIRDDEIAQFTNYVAAGGFLVVGSSAFTRNTNGASRSDFAFANELGVHMVVPGLANWAANNSFSVATDHLLVTEIPTGQLTWRMPAYSEEISWGISPSHPFLAAHDVWQVRAASGTIVVATGDNSPLLLIKPFGNGYFIYNAAFQPLIGHGGFAPGMYAYMIFRRAIEWAFQSASLPVPRLSPWPYPYDAALMVRHDLENFTNEISSIAASAQVEYANGAKGDYYFCTGTVRDDTSGTTKNNIIAGLRSAVTSYAATIGPHNGGLKNPNNLSLVRGQYDYWHWGPDEALDVTPSGYASGKAYAFTSISNSFADVEGWLSGTGNGSGLRTWVACYFNGTRENSYDIQSQLGVKITGDQKISPFPHWTLSTQTSGKRYACLSEPVSDWFVGGLVAQSLEPWHPPGVHTSQTMHDAIDFYYGLGALINIYSHTLATGLGDAGSLMADYITYSLNTNLHPRLWSANAVGVYQWWLQRSNAQISVAHTTNGSQWSLTTTINGATHADTTIEILLPEPSLANIRVLTNGAVAGVNSYRTATSPLNGQQIIKVRVGTSVTNAVISYDPVIPVGSFFAENFDGVFTPALPSGWTASASGAQTAWVTRTATSDTSPNAAYVPDAANVGTSDLLSPSIELPTGQSRLSFKNNYSLEYDTAHPANAYDGGVLEIKIGTSSFMDILDAGGSFVSGGYNATVSPSYGNALAGRQAWSGNSGGFITTVVNLPATAAGQNMQLRWRCGTDSGNGNITTNGWYIDTVSITNCACACCWNTPPMLPVLTDQTIDELTPLTVNNAATDANLPAQTLTYSLVSPPSGTTIGTSTGIITWTPSQTQSPSTNVLTAKVTDNGSPALSATNSFTVTVREVNVAPSLPTISTQTVSELTLMTVTNAASNANIHSTNTGYTLISPPTGASISASGIITWTPSQTQSPSTNTFTTVVTNSNPYDLINPWLTATNSFTVIVREVNAAPSLTVIPNQTVNVLTLMTVTNAATNANIHSTISGYRLVNPPSGASISSSGVITWTPSQSQSPSTNTFTTVVTNSNPYDLVNSRLTATNSFTVYVYSGPLVVADSTTLVAEGFFPTNNAMDPGETVSLVFALKNVGGANTTNLVVTLLQTSGVTSPSGPQTYGALAAGGAAVSQPFTFTAAGTCGSTISPTLQLQDGAANLSTVSVSLNMGQPGTVFTQNFDTVMAPTLPSGWTTSATGAESPWVTRTTTNATAPNAAFVPDPANIGTSQLVSPSIALPPGQSQLTFKNNYNFEADANGYYDGGVLEIKIGAATFTNILTVGGSFASGGYNGTIATGYGSPIAGRQAWSGNSIGFVTTVINLPVGAAGQTVQLRWLSATDNGNGNNITNGWYIDSISISGQVCATNTSPVLPAQNNRTIDELTTLTLTNTASDLESPPEVLTYNLAVAPANAAISANSGVITWTPTQAQSPSTNVFTTVVRDNAAPSASATNTFSVAVREVNVAPSLPDMADQTVNELTLLTVTNAATNANIHSTIAGYALVNPPSGAAIDANGVITWTPTQNQSPSTNTITTVVTNTNPYDLINPRLTASKSFTVVVREVNAAPTLPDIPDQTVNELALLTVSNAASNENIHSTIAGYALVNPPSGAVIDANGLITWTPTQNQSPSTNTITTVVTNSNPYDLVNPRLTSTKSCTVIVREVNVAPTLPVIADQTVNGLTLLTVTNTATNANIHSTIAGYALINPPSGLAIVGYASVSPPTGAAIAANGVITWTPGENQCPSTNIITSVVTNTNPYDLINPQLTATNSFTVFVIATIQAAPPVVQSISVSNGIVTITWSAVAGRSYTLDRKDGWDGTNWTEVPPAVSASGSTATDKVADAIQRFYRVVLQP